MSIQFHREIKTYTLPDGTIPETAFAEIHRLISLWTMYTVSDDAMAELSSPCEFIGDLMDANTMYCYRIAAWEGMIRQAFHETGVNIPTWRSELLYPSEAPTADGWRANVNRRWKQIVRLLRECNEIGSNEIVPLDIEAIENAIGTAWTISGNGKYVGTFPKRVARYLRNEFNLKLKPIHLETIGNVAREHIFDAGEYRLAFNGNLIEGSASDFYYAGSCWWGSYAGSRYALEDGGGAGILRYDDADRMIGRAWILPVDEGYAVFNDYGQINCCLIARILSTHYGLSYRRCEFVDVPDGMYLNGRGYLIADAETIETIGDDPCISFGDLECPDMAVCHCDRAVHRDDMYFIDNEWYCQECADEASHCDCCDHITFADMFEIHQSDSRYPMIYCESCASQESSICEGCSDQWIDTDLKDGLCPECGTECDECGYRKCDIEDGLCDDCGTDCDECGDRRPADTVECGICDECEQEQEQETENAQA
jgi:hypothetical protein